MELRAHRGLDAPAAHGVRERDPNVGWRRGIALLLCELLAERGATVAHEAVAHDAIEAKTAQGVVDELVAGVAPVRGDVSARELARLPRCLVERPLRLDRVLRAEE